MPTHPLPLLPLMLALAACATTRPERVPPTTLPPPPDAPCAAQCFAACPGAAGLRLDAGPDDDDVLDRVVEQLLLPLRARIDACELRRQACVACLEALHAAGVIRLPAALAPADAGR